MEAPDTRVVQDVLFKWLRNLALTKPVRMDKYRAWVKSRPCARCSDGGPCDPHHVFGSAMSLKSSDEFTVPLCRKCHELIQDSPEWREKMMYGMVKTMAQYIRGKEERREKTENDEG